MHNMSYNSSPDKKIVRVTVVHDLTDGESVSNFNNSQFNMSIDRSIDNQEQSFRWKQKTKTGKYGGKKEYFAGTNQPFHERSFSIDNQMAENVLNELNNKNFSDVSSMGFDGERLKSDVIGLQDHLNRIEENMPYLSDNSLEEKTTPRDARKSAVANQKRPGTSQKETQNNNLEMSDSDQPQVVKNKTPSKPSNPRMKESNPDMNIRSLQQSTSNME